jgi:hypothetical protein
MQLCKYKLFVLSPIPYHLWQTICIIHHDHLTANYYLKHKSL